MTEEITLTSPSLPVFLDRLGLSTSARDRVIAIDRELARKFDSDELDADGCVSLVMEAADLIADLDPQGFDWRGWDEDSGDAGIFDIDGIEWGEE